MDKVLLKECIQTAKQDFGDVRAYLDTSNVLNSLLVEKGIYPTIHEASFEEFAVIFQAGRLWEQRSTSLREGGQ